jgi:hypothetical protein
MSGVGHPAGPGRQLADLVGLRWQMVRARRTRFGLFALAGLAVALLIAAVVVGQLQPRRLAFNVALVMPTAYLGFAALAAVATLVAGGGNELFPPDQLAAMPVRPATRYLATLLVTPLNVAWLLQVLALCWLTGYVVRPGPGCIPALIITLGFVVFATVFGQAAAWVVLAVRHWRAGRTLTWLLLAGLVGGAFAVHAAHLQYRLLDRSPTVSVVLAVLQASAGRYGRGVLTLLVLAVLAVCAALVGGWLHGWVMRQPDVRHAQREGGRVRRRRWAGGPLRELIAVDRASIWRSAPLRRGLIMLTVLPGIVAALAGVEYRSLILLPALVAPAGGLLFGVNLFCLDGSGAVWLASQPHPPGWAIAAKAWVLTETCLGTVLLAVVLGCLRTPHPPTAAELVGLLGSVVVCVATVVATCLRLSVRRPHRAELRGRRDTPVPPGTMAVYSALLAVGTTLSAIVLAGATAGDHWDVPALLGLALLLRALWSIARTVRAWHDPVIRATATSTVAYG